MVERFSEYIFFGQSVSVRAVPESIVRGGGNCDEAGAAVEFFG